MKRPEEEGPRVAAVEQCLVRDKEKLNMKIYLDAPPSPPSTAEGGRVEPLARVAESGVWWGSNM